MIRLPERLRRFRETLESNKVRHKSLNVALLVIRLALAWIFVYYGAAKLFGWFNGAGLHSTSEFFATTAHLHPGMFFAVLGGVTEFFGGIAIGLGLLSRLVGLALFVDMIMAMVTVTFHHGLAGGFAGTGYGLNVALAALALAILLLGAGPYALGKRIRVMVHRS